MQLRRLSHVLTGEEAVLQASFSSSCSGFQPAFQNFKSSSQPSHSVSVHVSKRNARLSNPSLRDGAMSPLSMASFHSTCICRIWRLASSG